MRVGPKPAGGDQDTHTLAEGQPGCVEDRAVRPKRKDAPGRGNRTCQVPKEKHARGARRGMAGRGSGGK